MGTLSLALFSEELWELAYEAANYAKMGLQDEKRGAEMELVITLPEEVKLALVQRAHERGYEDVTNYVERLIHHDLFAAKTKQVMAESPQKTNEALAAVHRLTNLFADTEITHLDQILLDPMLELANIGLDEILP